MIVTLFATATSLSTLLLSGFQFGYACKLRYYDISLNIDER